MVRDLFVHTHLSSTYRGEESIEARHMFYWFVESIGRIPEYVKSISMPILYLCQFDMKDAWWMYIYDI